MTDRLRVLREALGSGAGPVRVVRAPGRVNLIGEHVDYAGGLVLPFACNLDVLLAFRPAGGPDVVLRSRQVGDPGEVRIPVSAADADRPPAGWGRYVWGVLRALDEAGLEPSAVEGVVDSTVPPGAGLSSSAALEAAVALAALGGRSPEPQVLRRAEQLAVGVPCGLMDQAAVLHGRAGHALLLDCESESWQQVPIPPGLGFVVVDTGTRRALDDGRYAARRAELEAALGGRVPRRLHPDEVASAGDPGSRRVRHVVGEIERVRRAASAMRSGDLETLGRLVGASHVSLRDDYEVSSSELDRAVELLASQDGCFGARLVGAGFAGCVLALVLAGTEHRICADVERALPRWSAMAVEAVDGAAEIA